MTNVLHAAAKSARIGRKMPEQAKAFMDTDIDECVEYDWDSAIVFDEKGVRYDSHGKKQ